MRGRKALLTVFIALALMGLLWVGTAVASAKGLSFGDGTIELQGIIQELGTDSFVVNGLTVAVDETTGIKEGDEHLELAALEVEWTVKVEGFLLADGTILAQEIKVISREPVPPSPTITPTPPVTPTLEGLHPVGQALAAFFDTAYDEVMAWHEDGVGFGKIAKAYFLAGELSDEELTAAYVLDRLADMGWGRLMKTFGFHPSGKAKNLGWVMSGRGDDDGTLLGETDNHPGKGHGPPEKAKDKNHTPPGHSKEKGKDRG
jgi:hypothetical protein